MFAEERHRKIVRLIRERQSMEFSALRRLLNVSPATLRRDLTELEQREEVLRVHGGILDPGYLRRETSFDQRMLENGAAKKSIAQLVAKMIPDGATVFVDAGSTCLEAGKALLGRPHLRLITHSVSLLEASRHGQAEILCLGGVLRKVSGAMTGPAALGALKGLRADWALVGASGLDPIEGCSTTEPSEAELKRTVLTRAHRKVLLADSSKWKRASTVRFAAWHDFSDWIAERPPAGVELKGLLASGLKLHHADFPQS